MLFAVIALLLVVLLLSRCATKSDLTLSKPACSWDVWIGNPEIKGITQNEILPPVLCSDPHFKDFVCLTETDLKNLLSCGGK